MRIYMFSATAKSNDQWFEPVNITFESKIAMLATMAFYKAKSVVRRIPMNISSEPVDNAISKRRARKTYHRKSYSRRLSA